ncbi:hypothetical protein EJB05_34401, partial [Eragrostis curvula]
MAAITPLNDNHILPSSSSPLAMPPPRGGSDNDKLPWEYSLRKYLLLLATLVATVTYTAGFTPPGGVFEKTEDSHLAGDPIIRYTSKFRYVAFFYSNATAFASSLVVIVLILILSVRHELASANLGPLSVLRGFMLLDLLSLIGAYTAGTYRNQNVPVYTLVLASLTVAYIIAFHMVVPFRDQRRKNQPVDASVEGYTPEELRKKREKPRKVLMLLATFAVSVTYLAGLSAPGGFWNKDENVGQIDGHRAGDPILMGGSHERLKVFVRLNSTAFFCSLLITVQLLDKNLRMSTKKEVQSFRFRLLYASIVVALLGLVGAYATGSSRATDTTIYVTLLVGAVPASIILFQVILLQRRKGEGGQTTPIRDQENQEAIDRENTSPTQETNEAAAKEAQSLVLLLATLAVTITYQAGLDPPGGLWEEDGNGYKAGDPSYKAGDPILLTMHPARFKAFFYSNSVAFVASLLAIILVKMKLLLQTHALQVAVILNLFGLIGAYAAGSCRDVSTSIYATALAWRCPRLRGEKALEVVEKRRKRLLLFAILAATITYQAGLTPPGGFRTNKLDDHAGDPVLLYNSPPRYNAFFYCNSVSFMLSIAMILLLVNPNLYKPAIQSHAISVCTAVGMFGLVGAYAAGSTQHMRTSLKIFGLAAAILIIVVAVVLIFVISSPSGDDNVENRMPKKPNPDKNGKKQHSRKKYLMLLGILGASVTYQVGLKPPGGTWQEGINAGNPVMHDNGRPRYLAFFYINSTSFVASIIVIILLLLKPMRNGKLRSLKAMNTTIMLDLLGLLLAYAVGSTRSWKITAYVFTLVFIVLAYIDTHVRLARLIKNGFRGEEK